MITYILQEEPWILFVQDYCLGVMLKILYVDQMECQNHNADLISNSVW